MRYFEIITMPFGDTSYCFLDQPPTELGLLDYRPVMGVSIAADYPDDVRMYMTDGNPGIRLPDLIGNAMSLLIVSRRMKEAIASIMVAPIEYLPVAIYNHKKRLASADYFLINPIGALDCLNLEASNITWFEGDVVTVDEPVIDAAKMKDPPNIFRIREAPRRYVMTEVLARSLLSMATTNLYVEELRVV